MSIGLPPVVHGAGREPVDILIQLSPRLNGTLLFFEHELDGAKRLKRLPYFVGKRTRAPLSVEFPHPLSALLEVSRETCRSQIYSIGASCFLISDAFKTLLDGFSLPYLEAIKVPVSEATFHESSEVRKVGPVLDEPYWLVDQQNYLDLIDRERSIGALGPPSELAIALNPQARDRPPEFRGEVIVLKVLPSTDMFEIEGLARKTFVSERLYDAVLRSGLLGGEYHPVIGQSNSPFLPFRLDRRDTRDAGLRDDRSIEEQLPYRLNGRTLHWGRLSHPLGFDPATVLGAQ